MMRLRVSAGFLLAGLLLAANQAAAQRIEPRAVRATNVGSAARSWTFGPVKPHLVDAVKRTGYGLIGGGVLMGVGLGLDKLNSLQCGAGSLCSAGNPVQAGIAFGYLGTVAFGTAPLLSSKCNRSGRALFGMLGAAAGLTAVSLIADVRLLTATTSDKATFGKMSAGLLGMSVGTGVATSIC